MATLERLPVRVVGWVRDPHTVVECKLLGGSWVVISRVLSPRIRVISIVSLLITPLIPTHEPPSRRAHRETTFRTPKKTGPRL